MDTKKLNRFLGIVSVSTHDLNNTLAALRGFAEFLTEDLSEGTPEQNFATKILASAIEAQKEVERLQVELRVFKE